jgi:uncharacterized membrane protein (DUF106 family)
MTSILEWLSAPPNSTIFILCLSALISFITSQANLRLTNREQLKAWNREIIDWKSKFDKARKTDDKKLFDKVKRQESHIMSIQGKMFRQQMKPSLIFIIPFYLFWLGLTGRLLSWQLFETPFSGGQIVAYLPWLNGPIPLTLIMWYLLCSLTSNVLFQRIFGLGMSVSD